MVSLSNHAAFARFAFVVVYLTVALTWALVQQHWKPPPPSPDMSFACARRMYSPGAVKVAVVVVLPSAALSISGFGLLKLTSAGPRCRVHVSASSGRGARPRPPPPPPPVESGPPGSIRISTWPRSWTRSSRSRSEPKKALMAIETPRTDAHSARCALAGCQRIAVLLNGSRDRERRRPRFRGRGKNCGRADRIRRGRSRDRARFP